MTYRHSSLNKSLDSFKTEMKFSNTTEHFDHKLPLLPSSQVPSASGFPHSHLNNYLLVIASAYDKQFLSGDLSFLRFSFFFIYSFVKYTYNTNLPQLVLKSKSKFKKGKRGN